jgi:hypothetical protein
MAEAEQSTAKRRVRPYKTGPHNKRPVYVAGIELPRGADARTRSVRKLKALVAAYVDDLGGALGDADKTRVLQAALIDVQIEALQSVALTGGDVDHDSIIRLSSERRRLLHGLGTKVERTKPGSDAVADLQAYLAQTA